MPLSDPWVALADTAGTIKFYAQVDTNGSLLLLDSTGATIAKQPKMTSGDSTSTGAVQTIAHGMTGYTPDFVLIVPKETGITGWFQGIHTATNILVTVEPTDKTYKWVAVKL